MPCTICMILFFRETTDLPQPQETPQRGGGNPHSLAPPQRAITTFYYTITVNHGRKGNRFF